ncbi:MAG: general secretion pathway protein GspK [Planctomycetota bacterium]|nr:MAG: general secretion pathway protein GspK [Planctomycetota bacterium]
MSSETTKNYRMQGRRGIVLLMTLALLVVLSVVGYTLAGRIAAQRHRDHYIIDYQAARYGCDSAVKYALAVLEDMNRPKLIARPNEPDFSDLFWKSEEEYREYLAEWAAQIQLEGGATDSNLGDINDINDVRNLFEGSDFNEIYGVNDVNGINDFNEIGGVTDLNDVNLVRVRGPYGPPWPFVTEPVEFQIGSATVRIEIEDENAKYPIGWAMLADVETAREAEAGLETFCEWMSVEREQIDSLKEQLEEISEIKPFKLEFKPIKVVERRASPTRSRTRTRRGRRRVAQSRTVRKTIPASVHVTDFAKLFHSGLIDTDSLARPTIESESRKESALKYMGMWASRKVNINTAPRHVLEAAFTFGGDADKIADEIIRARQIKPFDDVEELRKLLFSYSDSIVKCEKYITTASDFFTVRVTAVSGVAKASAVIAVSKEGKKMEKIAVLSG